MNAQERLNQFLNNEAWRHLKKTITDRIGSAYWVMNSQGEIVYHLERDTEFCQVIKESPRARQECKKLALSSLEKVTRQGNKTVVDVCPHGLLFYLCPLVFEEELIGIIGGCEIKGNGVDTDTFSQWARGFELDEGRLLLSLSRAKPISIEVLKTEAELLNLLADLQIAFLNQVSEMKKEQKVQLERERLTVKIKELEKQAEEIIELKQESVLLREETEKLIDKLEGEEVKADDLAELKTNIERLKTEIVAMENEAKRLRSLAKELEKEAEVLEAESKEALELKTKIKELKAQAAAAEERGKELAAEVAKAEEIIARSEEVIELKTQRDELDTLYNLTRHLPSLSDPEEMVGLTLDRIQAAFDYHLGAYVLMINEKTVGKIKTLAEGGQIEEVKNQIKENWLRLQAGDEGKDISFTVQVEQKAPLEEGDIQSVLSSPLVKRGKVIGLINIGSLKSEAFSPSQKRLFSLISSHLSSALAQAGNMRRAEDLVERDELTGAFSFGYFNKILMSQFAYARRYTHSLSLILFDFDRLKVFNDRFSHEAGNRLLKSVIEQIKDNIREVDYLARWSGDRFIILLPETNKKLAARIAERLRKQITGYQVIVGSRKAQITISLGVVTYPHIEVKESKELFMRANEALYQAKQRGGNQVFIYGKESGWRKFLKRIMAK
ncbi:MAG: diguanylate cyclase [bacterium]